MIRIILLFCFSLLTISTFAQPANDDCGGIIDLGEGPSCDSTTYNNANATATQIFNPPNNFNVPSCWDNVNNDVWFQFTVPADGSIVDFTIAVGGYDINGDALSQPQLAVYRGDCAVNELDELLCAKADAGESELELDLLGLTPGIPYFLRIDTYSATATPNFGDFVVCVDTLRQVNTIDEGFSNSCSGELYDTGGPDDDYGNGENNVFTICPPAPSNNCITYTMEYYNIESFSDEINIYDGSDVNGTLLANLDGFDSNGDTDGAVCFVTQASSGCITIEMLTDGNGTFEGFASNWACSTQPCEDPAGLQVDATISTATIAESISSPQTVVTIDTIICPDGAYGTFIGDDTDLGMSKGLLLTTGGVNRAVGPNNSPGDFGGGDFEAPGDADLDTLSANTGSNILSFDACVVELDVFAAGDELTFEYIFGSEEYPEYVNSINDIFAFLISGPGIVGDPTINNQLNIATIPGTNTPIEINSVNNVTNWEYFRNNINGESIQYDGLTSDFLGVKKSLTARADVTPCNTYHLKLAVADRSDGIFDSGVFIAEISGGKPQAGLESQIGIDYLVEGCSGIEEEVTFFINEAQEDETTFVVNIGGTALNGIDFTFPLNDGDTLRIPAGQTSVSFPIVPITDLQAEGTETIDISLTFNFGCGDIVYYEFTIPIEDEPVIEIATGDTAFVCLDGGVSLNVEGATTYFWTPVSLFPNSDPSSASPFAEPTTSGYVSVVGQVGPCTDTDSTFLQIIDPQISINALTVTDICEGTNISLEAVNNVGNQGLVWSPMVSNPNDPIITDDPSVTTTYSAIVELEGCQDTATYTVNVDAFDFPNLTTTDTTICESYTFVAADSILNTTTTYVWTPDTNLNDNMSPSPTIEATAGTVTYTVTATSENAFCSQSAMVTVTGVPANADINNADLTEICDGESVDLTANTSTAGVGFEWFSVPADPTLSSTDTIQTVTPEVTTTYYTQLTVGACTVFDSVLVRLDSMPDLQIMAIPDKAVYCVGDTVILVSPTYQPSSFPAIMHMWNPDISIQSDLENLNLVVSADETKTYTRTTTNRGCDTVTTFLLEVIEPVLQLSWTDTTICVGQSVQIEELVGDDNFSWSPSEVVTAGGDTNNPTLAPTDDVVITVNATVQDCPAEPAVANIEVLQFSPDAMLSFSWNDTTICLGEEVQVEAFGADGNYVWTPQGGILLGENTSTPTFSPGDTMSYILNATLDNCPVRPDTVTVNVNPLPNVFIVANPSGPAVPVGTLVEFTASVDNPNSTLFFWTYNNMTAGTDNPTFIRILEEGGGSNNLVMVTVEDEFGCEGTDDKEMEGTIPDYRIPNAFTPDGDGVNDFFNITYQGFQDIGELGPVEVVTFKVWNRWGNLVYDNENPTQGWDGMIDDKAAPMDVYVYLIQVEFPNGTTMNLKGENGKSDITLIR